MTATPDTVPEPRPPAASVPMGLWGFVPVGMECTECGQVTIDVPGYRNAEWAATMHERGNPGHEVWAAFLGGWPA